MKAISDERRWAIRSLVLSLEWEDETVLAVRAEGWVSDHRPWAETVKWSQWEGLRRQGEAAREWKVYRNLLDGWLTDQEKENKPARRAWSLPSFSAGGLGIRDELLKQIDDASLRPESARLDSLDAVLKSSGLTEEDIAEINDLLRVRRAQKFVELLVLNIKTVREEENVRF